MKLILVWGKSVIPHFHSKDYAKFRGSQSIRSRALLLKLISTSEKKTSQKRKKKLISRVSPNITIDDGSDRLRLMDESHMSANRRPLRRRLFDSRRRSIALRISNTACRFRFAIPLRPSIQSMPIGSSLLRSTNDVVRVSYNGLTGARCP